MDHRQSIWFSFDSWHIAETFCIGGEQSVDKLNLSLDQIADCFHGIGIEDFLNFARLKVCGFTFTSPFKPLSFFIFGLQTIGGAIVRHLSRRRQLPLQKRLRQNMGPPKLKLQSLRPRNGDRIQNRSPTRCILRSAYTGSVEHCLRQDQAVGYF